MIHAPEHKPSSKIPAGHITWVIVLLALSILILMTNSALANTSSVSQPEHRVLKSASELDYPPFSIVRENGEADGFSVELLHAVAQAVGLDVTFRTGPWHKIKQDLAEGRLDVLPLVSYSPERDALYDFTAPYLRMHGTVFIRKGDKRIHTRDDLNDKEILVMRGDTAHEYALKEHLSDKLILTDSFEEALLQLSQGRHDAVVVQELVGLQLVKKLGISNIVSLRSSGETDLKPTDRPLSGFEQKFCFAVINGNYDLLTRLNEGLAIIFANGIYNDLYDKWFGPILPSPPVPLTRLLAYLFSILVPLLLAMSLGGIWYLNRQVAIRTRELRDKIRALETAETALREERENYRITLNSIGDAVIATDSAARIIHMNPVAETLTGWSRQEAAKQPLDEVFRIINEQTRKTVESPAVRVIQEGVVVGLANHTLLITKHGREIPIADSGAPIKNETGETTGVVLVFRDQTEEREFQQQLKNSEEKHKALYEHAPIPYQSLDPDGSFLDVNPAWLNTLGYTRDEIIGTWFGDYLGPESLSMFRQKFPEFKRLGSVKNVPFRIRHRNGDYRDVLFEGCIGYTAEGAVKQTYCVFKDVTDQKHLEDQRERSRSMLKATLEATVDGILVVDDHGKWAGFNRKFIDMWSIPAQLVESGDDHEAIRHFLSMVKDPDRFMARIHEIYRDKEATSLDTIELEDGRFLERHSHPQRLGAQTVGRVWSFRDVTRNKLAEKTLRESEEKFRLTYSASPDAVTIHRLDNGVCVDINDGFTKLTGLTRDHAIGKTWMEVDIWHDPSDRSRLLATLKEKGLCENIEIQIRREDGSLTTALMSARVISLNGVQHIISIARDISDLKTAEFRSQRLISAIEQSSEIIVITDIDGTIQFVNTAFENITGYSRREAVGQNPRILKSGHHDQAFYKILWDTILAGRRWTGRLTNKRRDGALYTAECSISPVMAPTGEIANFIWIARDITRNLELEKRVEQSQRMEAIGSLAGGIAHDFNNLLFPIIGMAEILLEDIPEGSQNHDNLIEIYTAARRAGELVKQILFFSRQAEHKKMPIRVQRVCQEVLKLVRSTLPSTISIEQNIQADCGLVMADPTQIHQIVMNLITNAFHAMEQAGGTLTLEVRQARVDPEDSAAALPGPEPGDYAVIRVSDTGHGIDGEVIAKIFEPYFTTKGPGKGTGLGLSVVYGIVKDYQGDIHVTSEPGTGTTFQVYLPIIKNAADKTIDETVLPVGQGDETILLVDDEAYIARLEKQMLERLGYLVVERTSSIDALEAFKADPDRFDLVITDMTMPNMTGDRLAKALIHIRPGIPIIICTGYSEAISRETVASMGIKGFLMKPVVRSEMARMVRHVLDQPTL